MKYFSIKNFEKFQHYKDRNPSWIKLYSELLQDFEFSLLSEKTQLHLIKIWILGSRLENVLPYDQKFIARQIGAHGRVDLKTLEEKGFIFPLPNVSRVSPDSLPTDSRTTPEILQTFNERGTKAGFDENKGVMAKNASKSLAKCYGNARPETYKPEAYKPSCQKSKIPDAARGRGKSKKRPAQKHKFEDRDLEIAELIRAKILELNPNHRTPEKLDSWSNEIRLMRERDGRPPEEIKRVFLWANQDSFWQGNILSPVKLRNQFDQLAIKMASNGNGNNRWKSNADKNAAGNGVVI